MYTNCMDQKQESGLELWSDFLLIVSIDRKHQVGEKTDRGSVSGSVNGAESSCGTEVRCAARCLMFAAQTTSAAEPPGLSGKVNPSLNNKLSVPTNTHTRQTHLHRAMGI